MLNNRDKFFKLDLGNKLLFKANVYAIESHLLDGWSGQESTYRWTEGGCARLHLRLSKITTQNITLRMECSAFLANGSLNHQTIDVLINDEKVSTWHVCKPDWYEVVIPGELIKHGDMHIAILIHNPISPFETGLNNDKRKLGLCVKNLEVIESGAKLPKNAVSQPIDLSKPNYLDFGETLSFGAICASDKYLRDGWSRQEPLCRWTEGSFATLQFYLPEIGAQNAILRAVCRGYFAQGRLDQQTIEVLVNSKKVAAWTLLKEGWEEHEAYIPHEFITNGNAAVTFLISNPISPFDAKLSDDKRKLGFAVHSLEVVGADNPIALPSVSKEVKSKKNIQKSSAKR